MRIEALDLCPYPETMRWTLASLGGLALLGLFALPSEPSEPSEQGSTVNPNHSSPGLVASRPARVGRPASFAGRTSNDTTDDLEANEGLLAWETLSREERVDTGLAELDRAIAHLTAPDLSADEAKRALLAGAGMLAALRPEMLVDPQLHAQYRSRARALSAARQTLPAALLSSPPIPEQDDPIPSSDPR